MLELEFTHWGFFYFRSGSAYFRINVIPSEYDGCPIEITRKEFIREYINFLVNL